MGDDPERERGVLSKADRRFLLDSDDEEKKSSKGRVTRSRIRDRIYDGLLDYSILVEELEERDRQSVFDQFSKDHDLQRGATNALIFLYLALEEQNLDFETILVPAVESAEQVLASEEVDTEAEIEVEIEFDVETKVVLPDRKSSNSEEQVHKLIDKLDPDEVLNALESQLESEEQ